MTLRNANKRAKRRKRLQSVLNGHRRIEGFIEEKLRAALDSKLAEFEDLSKPVGIIKNMFRLPANPNAIMIYANGQDIRIISEVSHSTLEPDIDGFFKDHP